MRTRPDANPNGKTYRWILQIKDHFTKFCWARPLEYKEAHEVYHCVKEIFFMLGAPRILQSDNCREFVNELINSLRSDFPGSKYLSLLCTFYLLIILIYLFLFPFLKS